MALSFRRMTMEDLPRATELYIGYYNRFEGGCWTMETTTRRIRQVLTREDSLCLLLEEDGVLLGFSMGYLEQYDDLMAYDLVEIVIAAACQGQGYGKALMAETERQAKLLGAAMVQLQAVNDDKHHRFYGQLGYQDANNLVLKTKWLDGDDHA